MLKNLYLICGKSGSGKTYVADKLHDERGYSILKSYTTRKPRHESDDDHIYVSVSDYYATKETGEIAAATYFEHNFYWATRDQLNPSELYVIDKDGIESLKELDGFNRQVVVIYIDTSEDVRMKNMRLRGDSSNKIGKRLSYDATAFEGIEDLADFIVDGDDMNKWVVVSGIIDDCEEVED